jgi:hypothetical protein
MSGPAGRIAASVRGAPVLKMVKKRLPIPAVTPPLSVTIHMIVCTPFAYDAVFRP